MIRFIAVLGSALLFGGYWSTAQDNGQRQAERYIVECERNWAESAASGDTTEVRKFVADDFRGVDPDGSFYDKAKAIAETSDGPKDFVSNRLNEAKVRFYGDAAVVQGSESWERRSGTPRRGRFIWTDTWIKRDGKWQVVAAEDLIVPDENKN